MIKRISAWLTPIAIALAVAFGYRSKADRADKKAAEQNVAIADATQRANERARENLQRLNKKHTEEKADAQAQIAAGRRDHFDDVH